MFNFITQLLVLLMTVSVSVSVQLCGNQNQQTVDQAFIESGIVKDLGIKLPSDGLKLIEVKYSNVMSSASVSCGTELKSSQTAEKPMIKYLAKSNTFYTFMMLDLDEPSPSLPTFRSVIHWLVINVKLDDLESGFNIYSYLIPVPTPNMGAHRYVFMIFEQPKEFAIGSNAVIAVGSKFNVSEWVSQNRVFGPVAGNYFLGKNP